MVVNWNWLLLAQIYAWNSWPAEMFLQLPVIVYLSKEVFPMGKYDFEFCMFYPSSY